MSLKINQIQMQLVCAGRKSSPFTSNEACREKISQLCQISNLRFFSNFGFEGRILILIFKFGSGGGLGQWLTSRTTDQLVSGSSYGRFAVRCDLEQVAFTPCLVLVKPRNPWTYD